MNRDRELLEHRMLAIERIESYTSRGEVAFFQETVLKDAVIRNFEVIGEAAKGLSEGFRAAHPDVPWKQVAGMRDFLIHVYFGVNLERVWRTAMDDLAELRAVIEAGLNESAGGDG